MAGAENSRLRVGIVGAGMMAANHVDALSQLADVEITAVVDPDIGARSLLANRLTKVAAFDSLYPAIETNASDAYLICTPPSTHVPLARKLVASGHHVFVEKPLAPNVRAAHALVELAAGAGLTLQTGHLTRYDSELWRLADLVSSKALGDLIRIRARSVTLMDPPTAGWRANPVEAGGGVLLDLGVHAIDAVNMIMGEREPVTMYGQRGIPLLDAPSDGAGEDNLAAIWTYSDGTIVEFECAYRVAPAAGGSPATLELFFRDGYARNRPFQCEPLISTDPARDLVPAVRSGTGSVDEMESIYLAQMNDFVKCCLEGNAPVADGIGGIRVLQIVESIYTSLQP